MPEHYSIKDLERFTGIKAHTIRIWEKRYNIVEPQRSESNIRLYSDDDLRKLLNVSILINEGYKISRIAELDTADLNEKIIEINTSHNHHSCEIDKLIITMIELDEMKFEKILNTLLLEFGFEKTVYDIIYPFYKKIGILWQTGSINPAQEHFISNLIRRKLLVAIDALSANTKQNAKSCILFLPEWELHEVGLLLLDYFTRKSGGRTIYLGQSLPFTDLLSICHDLDPDYLLTHLTSSIPAGELKRFLSRFSPHFDDKHIFISGIQTENISFTLQSNITILKSAVHFKENFL